MKFNSGTQWRDNKDMDIVIPEWFLEKGLSTVDWELKKCTFVPKINSESRNMVKGRSLIRSLSENRSRRMKSIEIEWMKKEEVEMKECTF